MQGDVMHSCWRIDGQSPSSAIRSPGRFGDYFCDSPWSLIESAAKAMKSRQGDNVEFVLWTGDGLSHSALKESDTKRLEILRNITDLLGRTFSSQFVFPVLGHEDGTNNFRQMGELWRHWLPSEALHTFEKGGYYSIEQTKSRLRIIALNTNFMRHDHKSQPSHLAAVRQRTPNGGVGGNGDPDYKTYYYHHGSMHQHHGHSSSDWMSHGGSYGGYGGAHHRGMNAIPALSIGDGGERVSALSEYETQDAEKQWVWLEDELIKSKNNKETVYIVGHIPPGLDERNFGFQQNGHTTFTENNNKRYLELVRKYSSIIQGQFFGHLHSDAFRIIYDDNGKPVSWIMVSPSVTPRKLNVGSNNPAMRLYKFDTDSGQVLDYTQYFMDLQLANQGGEPNWLPEYNLTHYYALSDISAISLHNFVDRFTSSDGTWFGKYLRANTVRYQANSCEGVCMLNHYCAITRVDYKEFRQCLEKEQSALRSNAPAHTVLTGACPVLVLMCALLASCWRQANALLPKLIVRMRVQQQQHQQQKQTQRQQQLAAFDENERRQIEFVALEMTSTIATKNEAAITVTLIKVRTTAFALLLGILLALQYALDRSHRGGCKFPPRQRNIAHSPVADQPSAKMDANQIENCCMQRATMQLEAGSMLLRKSYEKVLLQQQAIVRCNYRMFYKSFDITAVAVADSDDKRNNAPAVPQHGQAHPNIAGKNKGRHAATKISTFQQRLPKCNCVKYRSHQLGQKLCFIIGCMWPASSSYLGPTGCHHNNTTNNVDFNTSIPADLPASSCCCNSFRYQQLQRRSSLSSAAH